MKLGVFNRIFDGIPLEEMLDRLVDMGVDAVELRSGPNTYKEVEAGRYPCQDHCDPAVLLEDGARLKSFQQAFARRGLFISGLSAHGNPIHPNKRLARAFRESFERNVLLAERLEIPVVLTFSGCPGGTPEDTQPNWITYVWPPEHGDMLRWQWQEVMIPYWRDAAAFAAAHHVKVAIEPHPNFAVYNARTLLRLREAVGETVGVNLDPSHLFWQGIDPARAIRALEGAIYHFHAKDCCLDPATAPVYGVLDFQAEDLGEKPWLHRSVGYGHDQMTWRRIISALRLAGYDYVLSIEHEDPLASVQEGVAKAVSFLKDCLLREPAGPVTWGTYGDLAS